MMFWRNGTPPPRGDRFDSYPTSGLGYCKWEPTMLELAYMWLEAHNVNGELKDVRSPLLGGRGANPPKPLDWGFVHLYNHQPL